MRKWVERYIMGVWVVSWLKRLGTTPQGPTKVLWGGSLQFDAALPRSMHRRERRRSVRCSMGRRVHRHPTLRKIREGPCLSSYCSTRRKGLTGVIGSTVIEATVIPYIEKFEEALVCKVFDRDDEVQEIEGGCLLTHRQTIIGVSLVRVEFHCWIWNDFI